MSDSDTRSEQAETGENDLEEVLDDVLDTINAVSPILSGEPVDVTLTIKVANAFTPQEAVDQFGIAVLRHGTEQLYFHIENEEGERFVVRAGQLVDLDGLADQLDEEEDAGGRG